ncbi:unnamed protein product [Clonostachys rosea f. rosea IK726]|uniref:Uncharacterized protein n=1 Tax=Clonostachys rosea f. rosea IK726 TaxID=1349383 RepID=A0ACA9U316_BIOOC|nr:unnamed protein product [Clonostachys rosea f. rosea IK726]
MMVGKGKMLRSNIFRACRKQLSVPELNDWGTWDEHVELSASTRVDDLTVPQCMDVFDMLQAAMKASGQPNPVPTDAQMESFLKLVLGYDKYALGQEMGSHVGEQNFNPKFKSLVGVSKSTKVYGHLDLPQGREMRYSLRVSEEQDGWHPPNLAPSKVQFTCKEPTQWMSQLNEEARLETFKYICNSNLLVAIQAARWFINIRLFCKEPYVRPVNHYLSLAGAKAHPFIHLPNFFQDHPFLDIICVERPRTVFDELSPGSEMLAEMMQKLKCKTEKTKSTVPDNGWNLENGCGGWGDIPEEREEEYSYEEGEATCTEEEGAYEDGAYEYEDEGFDYEDEGWDYEGQDE